jgi:hypothetical protein
MPLRLVPAGTMPPRRRIFLPDPFDPCTKEFMEFYAELLHDLGLHKQDRGIEKALRRHR